MNKKNRIFKKIFPIFLQSNYPKFNNELNKELRERLWGEFEIYLNKLSEEIKNKILPTGLADVMLNVDNPLRQNGWHPALILHFNQFFEKIDK